MSRYGEQLDQSLKEKNINMVRAMVISYIDFDTVLERFQYMDVANYAAEILEKSGITLFETDDGAFKVPVKKKWNKEIWNKLKVEIQDNFSHEKLNLMCEMMNYLRASGHPEFQIKGSRKVITRKRTNIHSSSVEPGFKMDFSQCDQDGGAPASCATLSAQAISSQKHRANTKQRTAIFIGIGVVVGLGAGTLIGAKVIGVIVGGAIGLGVAHYLNKNDWGVNHG